MLDPSVKVSILKADKVATFKNKLKQNRNVYSPTSLNSGRAKSEFGGLVRANMFSTNSKLNRNNPDSKHFRNQSNGSVNMSQRLSTSLMRANDKFKNKLVREQERVSQVGS